jgi:ABC-type glycerol-3-phosphate transport system substrate-binding protein
MQGQKVPYVVFIDTVYYNTIIYNQDLFAKLGIPVPSNHRFSSLAELTSAIAKLKAAGYAGIAFGADNTYACADLISGLLPTSASPSQLTNYLSNFNSTVPVTARYPDAAFLNVLRTIQGYNAKGFFQNGFLGMSDAQAQNVFLLGKAGMELPDSTLPSTPSFKTNWALLPPVNPGRISQIDTFSDSIGIPANAKHIALAEKFLEYYVSKQGQEAVAAAHSDLAVVNDVPLSAYGTGLPSTELSMITDAKTNGLQPGWTFIVPGPISGDADNPLVQEMFLGKETPLQIAQSTQAALLQYRKSS